MKSIRLNKEIREAIINNIAVAYDKANVKPVVTANPNEILEKAVIAHYMRQSQPIRKVIEANPELEAHIRYDNKLSYRTPTNSWEYIKSTEDKPLKVLVNFAYTRIFNDENYLSKNPSLAKAAEEWKAAQKVAREERAKVSAWARERTIYLDEIRQVLVGVSTTKQLLEQWEEVKEYIPAAYFNPSKINLPAINVQSLNAKLGK